jgi:hypothetical protein
LFCYFFATALCACELFIGGGVSAVAWKFDQIPNGKASSKSACDVGHRLPTLSVSVRHVNVLWTFAEFIAILFIFMTLLLAPTSVYTG